MWTVEGGGRGGGDREGEAPRASALLPRMGVACHAYGGRNAGSTYSVRHSLASFIQIFHLRLYLQYSILLYYQLQLLFTDTVNTLTHPWLLRRAHVSVKSR